MTVETRTFYRGTTGNNTIAVASGEIGVVFGAKGNDTITGHLGDDVLYGGAGNDSIVGGAGNDVILGDLGNDTLTGGEGDDAILGGGGNDVFIYATGDGADTLDGDAGNDTADFSDLASLSVLVGTTHMEFLVGTTSMGEGYEIETLKAGTGDDDTLSLKALGTNFTVDLSAALQKISGLLNIKSISGFEHVDCVDDEAEAPGNGTITGNSGANKIVLGMGDDTVNASLGEDTYDGGGGDDTLTFTSKAFTSTSALKFDLGEGELSYTAVTLAVANFEYIIGGKGKADILDGSGVTDIDEIGIKVDLSTAKGSFGLNIEELFGSVNVNDAFDALKGVTGFEIVYGTEGSDDITGDKGNNTIRGGFSDDTMNGGAGNDYFDERFLDNDTPEDEEDDIYGGQGEDVINGGLGNDTVDYGEVEGDVSIDFHEEEGIYISTDVSDDDLLLGIEKIIANGDGGDDLLNYSQLATGLTFTLGTGVIKGFLKTDLNVLTSVTGIEEVEAGSGNDKLIAGDKTTAAVENFLDGGEGNDTLDGGFGDDSLYGSDGNDSVLGGEGDDNLRGGEGNDTLDGGKGEDTLRGDAGNDKMTGGADDDWYYMLNTGEPEAFGTDIISDTAGTDDFLGLNVFVYSEESVTFTIVDGSGDKDTNKLDALKITIGEYGTITIDNFFNNTITSLDDLEAGDMIAGVGCIEDVQFNADVETQNAFDFAAIQTAILAGLAEE